MIYSLSGDWHYYVLVILAGTLAFSFFFRKKKSEWVRNVFSWDTLRENSNEKVKLILVKDFLLIIQWVGKRCSIEMIELANKNATNSQIKFW